MARLKATSHTSMALAIALIFMTIIGQSYGQLRVGFYNGKCGSNDVEKLIFDIVKAAFLKDKKTVAGCLRLQFHDCFVRGCDASILLDGSNSEKTAGPNGSVRGYNLVDTCKSALEKKCPGVVSCADIIVIATRVSVFLGCDASILLDGSNSEKTAGPNGSVRGYNLVDSCKSALEKECPGVVSCSDIIVIATRASVFLAGGKWHNVETGRRDGMFSQASEALANLPGPTTPINIAVQEFAKRGLTAADFVLLLGGGHTVGFIHCSFFQDRLYNFRNTGRADPTMSQSALSSLKKTCPRRGSNNVAAADQTPGSALIFDNGFYKAIVARKGLLEIDQQMAFDPITRGIVARLAGSGDFANIFGPAMVKLGRVGVLTGKQGQIRRSCRVVNRN